VAINISDDNSVLREMQQTGLKPRRGHREQARSHTGSLSETKPVFTENLLWERACSRWGQWP